MMLLASQSCGIGVRQTELGGLEEEVRASGHSDGGQTLPTRDADGGSRELA